MHTPRKPTQQDVLFCIDEQCRSNGNTTLNAIRFRLAHVHGWHTVPTHTQVRDVLCMLLSEDLIVRDGFAQGEHYGLTFKGRKHLAEEMARREAA